MRTDPVKTSNARRRDLAQPSNTRSLPVLVLPNCPGFRFRAGSQPGDRDRAYCLAFSAYKSQGLVGKTDVGSEALDMPWDCYPRTFLVLAEDENGQAAGTVTLVYDGPNGLPCDDLYADDLIALRLSGRRLAEVSRLAIAPEFRNTQVLLGLFDLISIHARCVAGYTDFIIEVNPRHANYYIRKLCFESWGRTVICPRVNGAPAELLRLDLDVQRELVGHFDESAQKKKTLYMRFCSLKEEAEAAAKLLWPGFPASNESEHAFDCPVNRSPTWNARIGHVLAY